MLWDQVAHNPSEINIAFLFGAQETFLIVIIIVDNDFMIFRIGQINVPILNKSINKKIK